MEIQRAYWRLAQRSRSISMCSRLHLRTKMMDLATNRYPQLLSKYEAIVNRPTWYSFGDSFHSAARLFSVVLYHLIPNDITSAMMTLCLDLLHRSTCTITGRIRRTPLICTPRLPSLGASLILGSCQVLPMMLIPLPQVHSRYEILCQSMHSVDRTSQMNHVKPNVSRHSSPHLCSQ